MLIDLDEFLRQNCIDRMDGKSCEECKHHVLEVSCERLMDQPTIDPVKRGRWTQEPGMLTTVCSECGYINNSAREFNYCPNCGALMREDGEEDG